MTAPTTARPSTRPGPDGRRPDDEGVRRFLPVIIPAVLGVGMFAVGHQSRALWVWGLSAVTLVLILLGVPIERWVARFALAVAHAVGWVASIFVGVGLVVVGGLLRLIGVDPLTPRARRGNGWQPAPSSEDADLLSTATFGIEKPGATVVGRPGGVRAALGAGVLVIGVVAALLLADMAVGTVWQAVGPQDETGEGQLVDAVNMTGNRETVADSRAGLPAMADAPWADAYFRELQLTPSGYWPFTVSKPQPFDGEYIDVDGWARATYESPDATDDSPVIWMFGGSTTFGEGQRDEYTIASWLARIAEEAGTPVKVVNYGQRGWTHFQEMILFEQLLAAGPPPDVALFYDGANEINAQTLGAKGVPTHTLTDQYAELISGGLPEEFGASEPATPSLRDALWDAYTEHSAVQMVVGRVRDFLDPPAGATTAASAQDEGDPGAGTTYDKTVEDAVRAVDVYARGRDLTLSLAERYDVEPLFYWQPVQKGPAELWADDNITGPTINISDALDAHQDVYIDGGHTNEEGARIVAERIWETLGPQVDGRS